MTLHMYTLAEIQAAYPSTPDPPPVVAEDVEPEPLPNPLPGLVAYVLRDHLNQFTHTDDNDRHKKSFDIAAVGRKCGLTDGQIKTLLLGHHPTMGRIMQKGQSWFDGEFRRIVTELNEKGITSNVATLTKDDELEALIAQLSGEMLDSTKLRDLPRVEPLIHGVYGRHSLVILGGRHGTFKTFIAFDWALCHATGLPWLGQCRVEPGRVLFLAGEGAYGLDDRKAAWEEHHGITVPEGMLTILPRVPRMFRNPKELAALVEFIRRGRYTLVVIDTLRRASSGARENVNDEMGAVIDAIEHLKRATDNGSVVILAHTDADDGKVRGATNIEDDVDVVYRTRFDGKGIKLWRTKNKYGPETDVHILKPKAVGPSVVVEPDVLTALRLVDKDKTDARLVYDAIGGHKGARFKGFKQLQEKRVVGNDRLQAALTWLENHGYLTVYKDKSPHEYEILKDWEE